MCLGAWAVLLFTCMGTSEYPWLMCLVACSRFTKRLQQENVENAKRAEDERRAQLVRAGVVEPLQQIRLWVVFHTQQIATKNALLQLKIMEEEERVKEEERKRAAKAKADAKAKLLLQAKLNEQKQELEERFAKLQRAKEQQQQEEQSVIDIFT